jgi:hypothetical protein
MMIPNLCRIHLIAVHVSSLHVHSAKGINECLLCYVSCPVQTETCLLAELQTRDPTRICRGHFSQLVLTATVQKT